MVGGETMARRWNFPVRMKAPCMTCDKVPCGAYHDQCEVYKEFKTKMDEEKEKKRLDNELYNLKKGFWADTRETGLKIGNRALRG